MHSFRFPTVVLGVAVLSFSLPACANLHPGSVGRTFEGQYERVFQATFEVLQQCQFPMKRVDRKAGRIVTTRRPIQVVEGAHPVRKVDARIEEGESGEVKVRLFLLFVDQTSGSTQDVPGHDNDERTARLFTAAVERSVDAGAVYDTYLDAIQKRVEAF